MKLIWSYNFVTWGAPNLGQALISEFQRHDFGDTHFVALNSMSQAEKLPSAS
ncbi:hypothetical protein [Pseudomonas syringae]|uniref:hypothetical protein n=1 Tax=Pseudomonas syringae TaxID=317 RepID=UPI0015E87E29|nr:hypothetical protein [Pseudomonas syringae]